MNIKVQNQWFDKRSNELTPKSHHDYILQHFETAILTLSKDGLWISFEL
jgi:hypothetical protein